MSFRSVAALAAPLGRRGIATTAALRSPAAVSSLGAPRLGRAATELLGAEKVQALPKLKQTARGLPQDWRTLAGKLDHGLDLLGHEPKSEDHRARVSEWDPVVKVVGDQRLRVALVGGMNAGKSTLFNCLVSGRHTAGKAPQLTKDFEGLTRDAVEAIAEMDGMFFTAIDTPGAVDGGIIEEAMQTIETCDVAVFVVAADGVITDEQRFLAEYLRRRQMPAFLVVNKADMLTEEALDDVLAEYTTLGLGRPLPISALTKQGLDDLSTAIAPFFHANIAERTREDWDVEDMARAGDAEAMETIRERNSDEKYIRVAVIGRSSSGKSTLLNRLIGYERNRSSDSNMTTRDAVEVPCWFRGKRLKLIDTAGMSRRKVHGSKEFFGELHNATLKAIKFAHICIVCFDATEGFPNTYDMALCHTCIDEGRPFVLCANKWDSVLDTAATAEAIDYKLKRQMHEVRYANAVVASGLQGTNLTLLLDQVLELHGVWNKRVRSSELTRFWRKLEKTIVLPSKISRISRLQQVNTRPPTFVVHLQTRDETETLKRQYTNLVRNAIAEEFGFRGVPIRVIQEVRDSMPDYI